MARVRAQWHVGESVADPPMSRQVGSGSANVCTIGWRSHYPYNREGIPFDRSVVMLSNGPSGSVAEGA